MFIEKVKCPKCGTYYENTLEACPYCLEKNATKKKHAYKENMAGLPVVSQILLYALGYIGLQIFATLVFIFVQEKQFADMFSLYFAYIICFVGSMVVLLKDQVQIKPSFMKIKPYLMGILIGIGLIIISYTYNIIINLLFQAESNTNQSTAESYVLSYPTLSIIIIGIVAPIVEEFTYRLGLFTFLSRIRRWVAYLLTVIIFAFLHFDFTFDSINGLINELLNLPNYLFAALGLCYCYERFGIASSISAHITNNIYSCVMLILMSRM